MIPRVPRRPYYLVRHGQSEWNLLEVTQGQTVAPRLTELGRAQARAAAELIRADLAPGARVEQIRTSDLVRARETAELLAGVLGGELVLDERLREQHLGDLEGRPYAETWAAAERHDWSDPHLPVAGGESPYALRERMARAVADAAPDTVLVSHGDAIRAVLDDLADATPDATPGPPSWVPVPNGAVARVLDGHVTWLGPAS
jgi:broad specificity phosphatase PhoE